MYFQADCTSFVVPCQCYTVMESRYYELVEILQMHKTTYTNYEQGKREPPFEFIVQLALFYDVTIDYIAGLTNTPRQLEKKKNTK